MKKFFIILVSILFLNSNLSAQESNKDISFYTGIFDTKDVGDDKNILFGIEHKIQTYLEIRF